MVKESSYSYYPPRLFYAMDISNETISVSCALGSRSPVPRTEPGERPSLEGPEEDRRERDLNCRQWSYVSLTW